MPSGVRPSPSCCLWPSGSRPSAIRYVRTTDSPLSSSISRRPLLTTTRFTRKTPQRDMGLELPQPDRRSVKLVDVIGGGVAGEAHQKEVAGPRFAQLLQ